MADQSNKPCFKPVAFYDAIIVPENLLTKYMAEGYDLYYPKGVGSLPWTISDDKGHKTRGYLVKKSGSD